MVEFNPDGSIKLPERLVENKKNKEHKLKNERCAIVRKDIISYVSPKKCLLHIKLSEAVKDTSFILRQYEYFNNDSEVPSKLSRKNEREFELEIGTCFRRCSDCTSFINRLREFFDNNLVEEKGGCTYERARRAFSFEDYFD